jgi:AcrR family transcriptional regulator
MPRSKQRTPELRDHILTTAQHTLAQYGVEGFTTKQIAIDAGTSVPAIYELFGDKTGLIRALFFEGFRTLAAQLSTTPSSDNPRLGIELLAANYRAFAAQQPVLAKVMFGQPFANFSATPEEIGSADVSRKILLQAVTRWTNEKRINGDPIDVAHIILATVQGVSAHETAGWLGTSAASRDRRWQLALAAVLDGFESRAHAT